MGELKICFLCSYYQKKNKSLCSYYLNKVKKTGGEFCNSPILLYFCRRNSSKTAGVKRKSAIILMLFVIVFMMAEVPVSLISNARRAQKDNDSIPADTVMPDIQTESSIKIKRDTTTMDSIELAIYKHNKAIDDSLAQDSINRSRKNGIDSPVEYSADDSLTYEAASGVAHLYGQSKVKYQNMDLQSERIYMNLDSNLVHATGKMDSTQQLTGTPIFKMGSDEYESDTMAFNFKSKKGLITEVYTQQDDGFLTSKVSKRGANGEMFLEHGRYTT